MSEVASFLGRTQRSRFNLSKILSQTGSGIRYVSVLYLVYHLDHSSLAIGVTLGIPSVVQILLAPLGGIVADRVHRPRLIAILYGLSGWTIGVLWWVTQNPGSASSGILPLVYILYGLTATADSLVGPAYRTLMSEWAPEGALVRWEGLLNALTQGFWLGGVLLTGVTIAVVGSGRLLMVSACLFMVAALMMIRQFEPHAMKSAQKHQTRRRLLEIRGVVASLTSAWKHLHDHPFMWAFAVLIGVSNIPHTLFLSLPFFLSMNLHQGYSGFGVLEACVVLGAVLGNVWIARRMAVHRVRNLLVLAFATQSVICLVLWMATQSSFIAVLILLTAYGGTDALFTPAYAHLSTVAPQAVRGQVFGWFNAVALLAAPISNVGLGWLLTLTSSAHIVLGLAMAFGVLAVWAHRIAAFHYDIIRE